MRGGNLAIFFAIISVISVPAVSSVSSMGLMKEEPQTPPSTETTTSEANQNEQLVSKNQNKPNCHGIDDGWWSPLAGPLIVNLCAVGPSSTSTSETSITGTESVLGGPTSDTPLASTPTIASLVMETKNNQGNSIISLGSKNVKVTAKIDNSLSQEQKDYNRGLLKGVSIPFFLGTLAAHKWLSEDIDRAAVSSLINEYSQGKSDAYKLGLLRGISMAREVMDTFVAPELIDVPN